MHLETMSEAAAPAGADNDISVSVQRVNLLDLLIILSRRRRFILWFTAGVAILTVVIVLLIPNKYTAESVVLTPGQNSSMSSAVLGQLGGSGALASLAGASLGIKNPGDTSVSLFRSRTVEDALIQRFGLMSRYHKKTMVDTRSAFEHYTTVVLGLRDGLIRVSVTDRDPKFAAELANAYVDEFRKHSDSLTITEASQRRAFFQQQLMEANEDLAKAEDAMRRTEQSTGVLQLDSQARALIESAADLRAQIAAKEVQLQSMRSFETADNPQYAMTEQQLVALQTQLAKVAGPDANASGNIGLSRTTIPGTSIPYLNALRDLRYYETITELLAKQFEVAKLDEAREGTIQISDLAVPPDKKSGPPRMIITVLATMLAFFCACGWAVFDSNWRGAWRSNWHRLKAQR